MTEMLHIFLSNRWRQVKPGTTGVAVPGYELRVLGEDGLEVPPGTPGTLFVRGDSAATGYWSRYDASRQVFQGEWLRTGDTYVMDADGYYACLGRTGDMLKASGIWVAPAEVESRLLDHADVAQAVVVAAADADGLEKPVAFVQLNPGGLADEETLIGFCRTGLPSFKRPCRIVFVTEYPTTATGKIRRVELRAEAAAILLRHAGWSGVKLGLRQRRAQRLGPVLRRVIGALGDAGGAGGVLDLRDVVRPHLGQDRLRRSGAQEGRPVGEEDHFPQRRDLGPEFRQELCHRAAEFGDQEDADRICGPVAAAARKTPPTVVSSTGSDVSAGQ